MPSFRTASRVTVVALLVAVPVLSGGGAPAPASAATGRAPALALPLSTQGNRVVDATGRTVVLRGLQRAGTEVGASPSAPASSELGLMGFAQPGSWHATLVRVPLGSAQWTGACPQLANDPAGYRAMVDAEVSDLTGQGVVALLDLHTSTAGCTSIARHAMPDAPVTQQFWVDVATRYAGNPLVAFELYNEPHYVPDLTWLQGTSDASQQDCDLTGSTTLQARLLLASCQAVSPRYKAVGMQELYDLVTAKAPGHLVVVDGNGWASSPSSQPVRASAHNLVYGLHPYTCPSPGAACDTVSNAVANLDLLRSWLTLASSTPLLVTEMGWPVYPKSDGKNYVDGSSYYAQTLSFLQQQSPAWGFVAFAFDGSATGAFDLVTSTSTCAPNSTGQPVYDLLRASA